MSAPEWTEEDIVRLRFLWGEGYSTPEIGRRTGRSKNSVVGKAHRLNLPSRPSPIKRNGSDPVRPYSRRQVRTAGPVTLAPLFALLDDPILLTTPPRERPAPKPVIERPAKLPVGECCFPISSGRPWKFCCKATVPGRQYCSEHWQATHVIIRRSDEQEHAA